VALVKGIEFAKDICFLNLIAESDSSNLIAEINDQNNARRSYVGVVVEDCIRF